MSDIKSINELTIYDEEARKKIDTLQINKIDDIAIENNNLILKANNEIKKEIDIPNKVKTVNNSTPDNNGNVTINSIQIQEYDDYELNKGNVHNYINHLCSENISSAKDLTIENNQLYLKQLNGTKIGTGVKLSTSSTVGSGLLPLDKYLSSGNYNKTVWEKGDSIHKEKLNKLEDVLYDNVEKTKMLPYEEYSYVLNDMAPEGTWSPMPGQAPEAYYFNVLAESVGLDNMDLSESRMTITYNDGTQDITKTIDSDFSPEGSYYEVLGMVEFGVSLTTWVGPNDDKIGFLCGSYNYDTGVEDYYEIKRITFEVKKVRNPIADKFLGPIDCYKIDFSQSITFNDIMEGRKIAIPVNEYYGLYESILPNKLTQAEANKPGPNLPSGGENTYYYYLEGNNAHNFAINTSESLGWKGIAIMDSKELFFQGQLVFDYYRAKVRIINEVIWKEGDTPTTEDHDIYTFTNDTNETKSVVTQISVGHYVNAHKVNTYIMFTKPDSVVGQGKVGNLRLVKVNTMLSRDKIPTKTSQLQNDSNFITKGSEGLGKIDNILFNQAGELEITINGVTKTFTPKV